MRRQEATWEERLLLDKVLGGLTLRGDLAEHGSAGRQDHGNGLLYKTLKEEVNGERDLKGKIVTMYKQREIQDRTGVATRWQSIWSANAAFC